MQQSPPIEHLPSLQQSAIPQHESPFSVEAVLALFCLCIGQQEAAVLSPVAFVLLKANAEAKSPKTNITDSAIKILFLIFFISINLETKPKDLPIRSRELTLEFCASITL